MCLCNAAVGATYAEAKHDRVGVIIGQRPEPVEFFLSGRVPET